MSTSVSSRTPEGVPGVCQVCGFAVWLAPTWSSSTLGDAPCPRCGSLVWLERRSEEFESHDTLVEPDVTHAQIGGTWEGRFQECERFERYLAAQLAEGVHAWNVESIKELIANADRTRESLDSLGTDVIPADARARFVRLIEELKGMVNRDNESKRNKFRAEQRRAERAELAARNETREILDRSLAPGLPPRQLPPPTGISRLIAWVRSTVNVHINPVSSYGTVYDRWLDG